MNAALEVLNTPWIGVVIGLVFSVITGVYFYRKGKRKTELSMMWEGEQLVGNKEDQFSGLLEIRYDGKRVERVTRTRVWLWNSGTETIQRQHLEATKASVRWW